MFRLSAWMLCLSLALAAAAAQPTPLVRVGAPEIDDIAYSPDGRVLAVATDFYVELLDADTMASIRRLEPGGRRVRFSPDGAILAAIGGRAFFFNAETFASLGSTPDEVARDAAVFLPGTDILAVATVRQSVALWDVQARTIARRLDLPEQHTYAQWVAFTSDGERVVGRTDHGALVVWDARLPESVLYERVREPSVGVPHVLSPNSESILLGSYYGALHVFGAAALDRRDVLLRPGVPAGGRNAITSIATNATRRRFATVVNHARIVIWNADTFEPVRTHDTGNAHSTWVSVYLPSRRAIATANRDDNTVHLWDSETGAMKWSVELPYIINTLAASPDGSLIATTGYQTTHVLHSEDGRLAYTMEPESGWYGSVGFSPSGRYIVGAGSHVALRDARTGEPIQRIARDVGWQTRVEFNADETLIASAGDVGERSVVMDVAAGEVVQELDRPGPVVATRTGFWHARIARQKGVSGWIEVYEVDGGRRLSLIPGTRATYTLTSFAARFSPGGGILAVRDVDWGGERVTRFHNARTGELLTASPLWEWTFTDDGEHLLARTAEGQLGLYRLADILRADVPVGVDARGMALTAWGSLRRSELLPNYPNPFNPETWIPFRLAESAEVTVRIYGVGGALVRTLSLGTLHGGEYVGRDRAARWDGRNSAGESVPSGVYPYEFRAGGVVDSGRMVILK